MRTTFHALFNVSFSGEFMKRNNLFIRRPPRRRGVAIEIILFRVRTGEFKYADFRCFYTNPGIASRKWPECFCMLPSYQLLYQALQKEKKKSGTGVLPVCYNTSFLVAYESITRMVVLSDYSNFIHMKTRVLAGSKITGKDHDDITTCV